LGDFQVFGFILATKACENTWFAVSGIYFTFCVAAVHYKRKKRYTFSYKASSFHDEKRI